MTITSNIRRTCFFCSKPIEGKVTKEHIIPDSLIGKLGIKEASIEGKGKFIYSRLKVPAHSTCNSEFGSRYENEIIRILDNPDDLYNQISSNEGSIPIRYQASIDETALITTWLSKIYYGLFYKDYLSLNQPHWTKVCKGIIDCENFRMTQRSYQNNHGFSLPSSIFLFKTRYEDFDLKTFVYPQAILIKIRKFVFVLCIADGYLTKSYLNRKYFDALYQNFVTDEEGHPNHYYWLLAEILAVRICIPKTPRFIYTETEVVNMSFSTFNQDPEEYYRIDENALIDARKDIMSSLLSVDDKQINDLMI